MKSVPNWQPLLESDLQSLNEIASQIHTTLPERPEVFADKLSRFPHGCRKLVLGNKMVGYGISHPSKLYSIPPSDEFLGSLPQPPECLYIHDVAVLTEGRGNNAAAVFVEATKALAGRMQIRCLALVSVYRTDTLWSRFGFRVVQNDALNGKLASYGPTAKYMVCDPID